MIIAHTTKKLKLLLASYSINCFLKNTQTNNKKRIDRRPQALFPAKNGLNNATKCEKRQLIWLAIKLVQNSTKPQERVEAFEKGGLALNKKRSRSGNYYYYSQGRELCAFGVH